MAAFTAIFVPLRPASLASQYFLKVMTTLLILISVAAADYMLVFKSLLAMA